MSAAAGPAGPAPDPVGRRAGRWGWRSLRLRLALAILAWVACGIGAIWFSATRVFLQHVEAQYHDELEVHVRELAGLVRLAPDGTPRLVRPLSDPRYLLPLSGFYWQVTVDGHPALRSASMTRGRLDERVAHLPTILHRTENGPTGPAITYGFVARGPQGRDVHYVIATDQRLLAETVSAFSTDLTGWLTTLAVLLLATGAAVVAFAFEPFDRLAGAVSGLRRGDRGALKGPQPSEIAPLADDLNAFIDHNAAMVERARVEAGNLAHSLRTPLAVITDEAERLVRDPATADSGETLLRETERMARQIEFRLARARSAASGTLPGTICRVQEVLGPILSAMRRLHPDVAFELAAEAPDAIMPIDPVDLTELLSNLLDNAGKWAGRRVLVTLSGREPVALTIADDGPGMAAADIAEAGRPGLRFDPDTPGSGLGLAIARDIAGDYGYALDLAAGTGAWPGLHVTLRPACG